MVSVVRLRHVALKVSDLAGTEKFFSDVFGMRVTERLTGLTLMTADPSSSHELALQEIPKSGVALGSGSGVLDHLAFGVNSLAEVKSFGDMLTKKGMPFTKSRSGHRLYFKGFDGIGFEVCFDPAISVADLIP